MCILGTNAITSLEGYYQVITSNVPYFLLNVLQVSISDFLQLIT